MAAAILTAALALAAGMATAQERDAIVMPKDELEIKLRGLSIQAGPAAAQQARQTVPEALELPAITFEFNSASLTPQARAQLNELGQILMLPEFAQTQLRIDGHTDSVGPDAYNMDLSVRRADAVKTYLVSAFRLSESRFEPHGLGETRPKSGISPQDGANRRVELVRLQ